MKILFSLLFLSVSAFNSVAWSAPCLDTHVRLVTKDGRVPDRKGIPVNLRVKGVAKPFTPKYTGPNGNACINYPDTYTGGEEVEIFVGVEGDEEDLWSAWSVISPYKGVTHFPKLNKQRTPIEVVIVPRYLEESLIGYAENDEKPSNKSNRFDCPFNQGRKFVQVITVGEKTKSEDIISSFRGKYFGCREGFLRDGKKWYRVLVEAKENTKPDDMCRDIRKNHIKASQFRCVANKLDRK